MTREEAISEWTFRSNHIKKWLEEYGEEPSIRHYVELIDMAIEALQFVEHFDLLKEYQSLQEVVRCKDCKYRDPEDERCDHGAVNFLLRRMDNDFCSYGERKGGD